MQLHGAGAYMPHTVAGALQAARLVIKCADKA